MPLNIVPLDILIFSIELSLVSATTVAGVGIGGVMIGGSPTGIVVPTVFLISGLSNLAFKLLDRKSTRLNSSHSQQSRMPSSA